jgi:predicted enzyme related to lactoylglutathione lyase
MTRAIGLGANALQAPHDVPNVGRVAVLRDPTGAVIGWLQ